MSLRARLEMAVKSLNGFCRYLLSLMRDTSVHRFNSESQCSAEPSPLLPQGATWAKARDRGTLVDRGTLSGRDPPRLEVQVERPPRSHLRTACECLRLCVWPVQVKRPSRSHLRTACECLRLCLWPLPSCPSFSGPGCLALGARRCWLTLGGKLVDARLAAMTLSSH